MLTVMFSTFNGAAVLGRTLDSMTRAIAPAGGWKLIAVDNSSTDASAALMSSYADRLPITVLSEPRAGKNKALNRALDHAEGDLYVFCDDDVVVSETWLVRWREIADAQPEYALFAGATYPLWPGDPPNHALTAEQASVVFATNQTMKEGPCDPAGMLGTNMAIRAEIFKSGVRYADNIGPDGSSLYPMGSETELALRLKSQGLKCWFAAGPSVGHIIRPKQLADEWMLLRAYRWGRGLGRMNIAYHYSAQVLARKNGLRALLYPLLMRFWSASEAWARHWEWMVDQGYEDGQREKQGLPPRWSGKNKQPAVVARFRSAARKASDIAPVTVAG